MARIKSKAAAYAPQTRSDCAANVKRLGDLQREQARLTTHLNDEIARITQGYEPKLKALAEAINVLHGGIQTWCEAHRSELCKGDSKTANLITGEVSWRVRPPSVRITGVDSVLDTLKRMGLHQFVRTKDEPNKEAMLNDKDAVRGIAGITIVSGVEDFVVTPFEADTEAA
jgi:phage host-nuclease inhibitor protein Gam